MMVWVRRRRWGYRMRKIDELALDVVNLIAVEGVL
jgi:hypothetical protein